MTAAMRAIAAQDVDTALHLIEQELQAAAKPISIRRIDGRIHVAELAQAELKTQSRLPRGTEVAVLQSPSASEVARSLAVADPDQPEKRREELPTVAPVIQMLANEATWIVGEEISVRQLISAWASSAGVQLTWSSASDFPLPESARAAAYSNGRLMRALGELYSRLDPHVAAGLQISMSASEDGVPVLNVADRARSHGISAATN